MSAKYRLCKGCGNATLSNTFYCSGGQCGKKQQHIKYLMKRNNITELTEELLEQYTEKYRYTHLCGFSVKGEYKCQTLTNGGYCKTHQHRVKKQEDE